MIVDAIFCYSHGGDNGFWSSDYVTLPDSLSRIVNEDEKVAAINRELQQMGIRGEFGDAEGDLVYVGLFGIPGPDELEMIGEGEDEF